ncbi:MAG: hypothetical protein ACKO5E_04375, partial [bacterium]
QVLRWPAWLVVAVLLVTFADLTLASRCLRGTSLRAATVWARLAVLLAILAMVFDAPDATGNGLAGLFSHICFLAILASLVSVLGARRPGENAWALLCGIFLVIGLLPMLEGVSLSRRFDVLDQLRLNSPWNYFLVLVIFAGVSNYLPTRFFAASLVLGFGLGYHLRLIWKPDGRSPWRGEYWWVLPWCLALCVAMASLKALREREQGSRFHALWQPFRDAWGAAWALRVLERFNQTAVRNHWPVRLHWFGLFNESGSKNQETNYNEALAENTLAVLIRRFGDVEKIERL